VGGWGVGGYVWVSCGQVLSMSKTQSKQAHMRVHIHTYIHKTHTPYTHTTHAHTAQATMASARTPVSVKTAPPGMTTWQRSAVSGKALPRCVSVCLLYACMLHSSDSLRIMVQLVVSYMQLVTAFYLLTFLTTWTAHSHATCTQTKCLSTNQVHKCIAHKLLSAWTHLYIYIYKYIAYWPIAHRTRRPWLAAWF